MKKNRYYYLLLIPVFLLAGVSVGLAVNETGANKRTQIQIPATSETTSEASYAEITEKPGEGGTSGTKLQETEIPELEIRHRGEDDGSGNADGDPLEGTGNGDGQETDETVTMLFAGDIYLSDHVLGAYDRGGGIQGVLDSGILKEIEEADYFVANQEFPFSDRGKAAADKQFTFRLSPSKVSMFQEMGIDLVTLANNHILDYGTDALLDSCETLDAAGIAYVGAGENLDRAKQLELVEIGGKTFGFLGLSRVYMDGSWAASATRPGVFSTYDATLPVEEIKKADSQCDYLIVYVHWGVERETMPKDYQRTLGKQYIDAGADLVIGSHPHVLQGMEYYQGKPIVYSLGNFVFGSSIPETALLKAEFGNGEDGTETLRLSLLPCTSSGGYTRQMPEEKQAAFYEKMTGLSFDVQVEADGSVKPE